MRALCGAIITAGAVIGLGLTALGIGTRYAMDRSSTQVVEAKVADGKAADGKAVVVEPYLVYIHSMDRPLVFCLVFLTCVAIIGLGIAFVGLAYHHHRRLHELTGTRHVPGEHHHVT